jgi:phytoene dehydrogenase-like protein
LTYNYDAVIVGSGPNGLAAAITLARAGCAVLVVEARDTIGGGMRSAELTLPDYIHDICSAAHPLGVASPFFRNLPLDQHGLEWMYPSAPVAHPLDNQDAVLLETDLATTAAALGRDGGAYHALFAPLVNQWQTALAEFLAPLHLPRYLWTLTQFGIRALPSATLLAKTLFREERARAAFAGLAAHSLLSLDWSPSAAFGIMLGLLAHAVNYPVARGGSQAIADAMARYLMTMNAKIETGWHVKTLAELPRARAYLLDTAPRGVLALVGDRLPSGYRAQLQRYRYAPGVFKVDYALSSPIPWRDAQVGRASTVHLGGTLDEIRVSERAIWRGEHVAQPYVLLVQPTLFDGSRAPAGKHVAWAYCHVPNGSTVDMTAQIDAQIERFAPGFLDCVLARGTRNTAEYEAYNPNNVGGDINAGAQTWRQLYTRPALRLNPYTTPLPNVYICSSATPPGGGVHGMCGYHAAMTALRRM